jgi:hypothetical protein
VNETVYPAPEALRKQSGPSLLSGPKRREKMITLKVIAVALGAGLLLSMYSGDLGADVILTIVACLS